MASHSTTLGNGPRPPAAATALPTIASASSPPLPDLPYSSPRNVPARERVSHACNRCRMLRTKCSGGNPCDKCIKAGAVCAFGDRKRERNKRDLAESVKRIEDLEFKARTLLQALKDVATSRNLDANELANIRQAIANCELEARDDSSDGLSTRTKGGSHLFPHSEQTMDGEHYADASVGSPARQDVLTDSVDFGHADGAVGFIGKMSEVSWIARAHSYLVSTANQEKSNLHPVTRFSYYMDEENLLDVDEDYVDACHWPGDEIAQILSEAYFHALQDTFNCINREEFLLELFEYRNDIGPMTWNSRRWLALANLVWAVGSKWLYQAKLNDDLVFENHLVYYARARALGLDHRVMLDHPGIQGVRALGILSFYLFMNGSVTSAWALLGLAVRNGTGLGLHLRVVDASLSRARIEERARIWYSIYGLEASLSEILGRPPSIPLTYTTVSLELLQVGSKDNSSSHVNALRVRSLWLSFLRSRRNTSQPMSGGQIPWRNVQFVGHGTPLQHFSFRIQLSTISNHIMAQLYAPSTSHSWAATQKKIVVLQNELETWDKSLPEELSLVSAVAFNSDPRAKIDLALYQQSLKMILYRPCLCHVQIPRESDGSKEFNRLAASNCVYAGMGLMDILPDDPTTHEAYQLLPWWNLLHYISQALGVFILELCLDMEHFQDSANQLTPHIRKAMAYLWCLSNGSLSSYKAWRIFGHMLTSVSSRIDNFDITDIPMNAYIPKGWTEAEENILMNTLGSMEEDPK